MTPREMFYLVFGAGIAFVLFLILRKRSFTKAVNYNNNPAPLAEHLALEIIREEKPEILSELEVAQIVELSSAPIEEISTVGPFNTADLMEFLSVYGTVNEKWNLSGSEDGLVTVQDLMIFLANFGASTPKGPDIVPAWNNFYNHAPSSNPNLGFDLFPIVQSPGVSWNDIKDDCSVEWFYNGILCSEDKDKCRFVDAVTRAGLCSGQFPLTCRITHHPSGDVYERTACSHINFTIEEGWWDINPDMQVCETECNLGTIDNLWLGPFDAYQFLKL